MRNISIYSIVVLYLSLTLAFGIFVCEVCLELVWNLPRNEDILSILGFLFFLFLFSYFLSLLLCYKEINRNESWGKKLKSFWKKTIFLKPISGITACCFMRGSIIYIKPIIIKFLFYSRIIFLSSSLISLFILFFFAKAMNIFIAVLIVIFFFCIPSAIMTNLIYESLILIHASQKDEKEWDKFDYYSYFTSLTSIFNPFSYSEYYRRQFESKVVR